MAKQVRLLNAPYKKSEVPAVLMSGDRYICAERLMTAASPGLGKEDKRTLSKKLAALAVTYGGAFRAKLSGADRWFVTRALLARALEKEIEACGNNTYARFRSGILGRIRVLSDMLEVSGKLCRRGFHRTESVISPEVDMSQQKGDPVDVDGILSDAARTVKSAACPDTDGEKELDGRAVDLVQGETRPEPAEDPGKGVAELLDGPAAMPDTTAAKLRDRLSVLSVVLGVYSAENDERRSSDIDLMAVREAVLDPGRVVTRSEWLSPFGLSGNHPEETGVMSREAHDRIRRCATACAGVWENGPDGPKESMPAIRLLANCFSKP